MAVENCGAITEGFKCLCVPLFRQIGYIKDLHENMMRLRTKMDALTSKAEDTTIEVDNAELHGKTRRNEVSNWLEKVRSIEVQVSDILKKLKEQNKCWDGCMPNYCLHRKISKMSLKLIIEADELIADGKFENVSLEQQAVLGCTLPTTSIASKTTADETLEEILGCILNTELRIIGVHGMGGVGKTTIMMNINNRLMKTKDFDDIIPHSYFNHMCSLRVLDLSGTRIKALPESISNLKNLRALLLKQCKLLKKVPSLSNLEELMVLDLSSTAIRELPSGMEAMVKLRRLNLDETVQLCVFPIGILAHLSFLEELTMHRSGWKWSSMTTEGARIEEIVNSTRLANLDIDFTDLSSFLNLVNSGNWQMMKNFRLCVDSSRFVMKPNFCVQINSCNLIGEDNSLLLPYKTQWLEINYCEFITLWNVTRSLNSSELCGCRLNLCNRMKFLMADEEPLLPDLKELRMAWMPELLALCKGIPSLDALKSLESLEVSSCHKLKYLLPARLLQQLRSLKHIEVRGCDGMEEIVAEEEEMEKGKNEDKSTLSQLQTLAICVLPNLKSISSRVLICNALETIDIVGCCQLKKLPFRVQNLPSALKQIEVWTDEKEWWDTLVWDHPQTQAHFQSLVQFI